MSEAAAKGAAVPAGPAAGPAAGPGADEIAAYWDTRHRDYGDFRSGGHIGYDPETNAVLYAIRLGRLLEIIGFGADRVLPVDVLDAGCGKGYFARGVAACGHRVDAIDQSPAAIEHARAAGGGPAYSVSDLAGWRSTHLYDVVYSIDVLFHIMDDDAWRASLGNLASLVRAGGLLVFTEWDLAERRPFAGYQVARARDDYSAALTPLGLSRLAFVPDGFRRSGVGFHVYRRVC